MTETRIEIMLDGAVRRITRPELIDLTHDLAKEHRRVDECAAASRVRFGFVLLQARKALKASFDWYLHDVKLNRKTANKYIREAVKLADAHGQLDVEKLWTLVHTALPMEFPDRASFDAARVSQRQILTVLSGAREFHNDTRNVGKSSDQDLNAEVLRGKEEEAEGEFVGGDVFEDDVFEPENDVGDGFDEHGDGADGGVVVLNLSNATEEELIEIGRSDTGIIRPLRITETPSIRTQRPSGTGVQLSLASLYDEAAEHAHELARRLVDRSLTIEQLRRLNAAFDDILGSSAETTSTKPDRSAGLD